VDEPVELDDVELEDDDELELLHPAASPAITASAEPAVTICLSFMGLLPFRIETSVIHDVDIELAGAHRVGRALM